MPSVRAVSIDDLRVLLGVPADDVRAGAAGDVLLEDATHDSREAGPGVLFCARRGAHHDGHDHVAAAAAAGSPAVLCERPLDVDVTQLVVPDVAAVLGRVAHAVHASPSERLALLGITGTSGKTTTAFLVEELLRAAGHRTGLLGTVATRIGEVEVAGVRTTPEATDLARLLARMVDQGVTAAAMEVSSHGLALHRVDATRFAAVGFTNLSQDHLDFHADLADYEAAKARLFAPEFSGRAVIDVDSPAGARMAVRATRAGLEVATVSSEGRAGADIRATEVTSTPLGSQFTLTTPLGRFDAAVRLPGAFNVANALLAWGLAVLGARVDPAGAAAALAGLQGVPGRMERVESGQSASVIVDYAHKPDALARVLATARQLATGRVVVVVGCGGDRDREKRPLMGRVAAEGADLAVLTSDNPRTEDPAAILAAVRAGAEEVRGAEVIVEADRRAAIGVALAAAGAGDVVIVAGKGHETYQEVGRERLPFDDRAVVRELVAAGGTVAPSSPTRDTTETTDAGVATCSR